jgi:hypothetical protein
MQTGVNRLRRDETILPLLARLIQASQALSALHQDRESLASLATSALSFRRY